MHIFSGQFKNRTIQAPKGLKTRPTSGRLREALFNICQSFTQEARFLDLFAGSGAMGLEALSRGAQMVTFIDNSKESIRCIQANVRSLEVTNKTEVIYGDVFEKMQKLAKKGNLYEIIYADPPYELISPETENALTYSAYVLHLIDQLIEAKAHLLAPGGSLFLEDAPGALPKNETLRHLVLKSARSMGRSALHHYVFEDRKII